MSEEKITKEQAEGLKGYNTASTSVYTPQTQPPLPTYAPVSTWGSSSVTYPILPSQSWPDVGAYTSIVADPLLSSHITGVKCSLPEDAMEKLVVMGMAASKDVMKQKLVEAFKKWCKEGVIEFSTIPVLMIACLIAMGINPIEEKEKTKSE